MDKRKSFLNITVSLTFKVITMVMVIFVKRLLIQYCGNEVNGLNALYLSIIGFLSVAELGVGSAITFCMYKPIVEGNNQQVSALYQLFRQLYLLIGGIIFAAGLCITPFIHVFARDYTAVDENLHLTFLLMLISVVATYLFSSKTSLINAYKNNYITTAITSGGIVLQYILQIISLVITKSFTLYLACRIISVVLQWIVTEWITREKYAHIISCKSTVDAETKYTLARSIKAMFMHQIGYVLVNTVDSIVIAAFIGVVALGGYSNYVTIMSSMLGLLKMVFSSLTSVIGHSYVQEGPNASRKRFEGFHLVNFALGMVFFLGYYAIADNLVGILFAPELIGERMISRVITINGFVQFMRSSALTFREATGTFYNDRWKPLVEGVVNLVLSIFFVRKIGVVGVIAATILTNLLICHVVEPYVLMKNAFAAMPWKYYFVNYGYMVLFVFGMLVMDRFFVSNGSMFVELLINGFLSVGISVAICVVVFLFSRSQRMQFRQGFAKRRK